MTSAISDSTIRIGVIGYGYWGPNIVRNLQSLESARVAAVCDRDARTLKHARQAFPNMVHEVPSLQAQVSSEASNTLV
jgi:predicted dehydrogenase